VILELLTFNSGKLRDNYCSASRLGRGLLTALDKSSQCHRKGRQAAQSVVSYHHAALAKGKKKTSRLQSLQSIRTGITDESSEPFVTSQGAIVLKIDRHPQN